MPRHTKLDSIQLGPDMLRAERLAKQALSDIRNASCAERDTDASVNLYEAGEHLLMCLDVVRDLRRSLAKEEE